MKKDGYILKTDYWEKVNFNIIDVDFFIKLAQNEIRTGQPIYPHGIPNDFFKKQDIKNNNKLKKFEKLYNRGLIVEPSLKELKEKGILNTSRRNYFKISPNGWFNLILYGYMRDNTIYNGIIHQYDKSIICKTFLMPYFELETLEFLSISTDFVSSYVENCCKRALYLMRLEEDGRTIEGVYPSLIEPTIMKSEIKSALISLVFKYLDLIHLRDYLQAFPNCREYDRQMEILRILAMDAKFVNLMEQIQCEFQYGYYTIEKQLEKIRAERDEIAEIEREVWKNNL